MSTVEWLAEDPDPLHEGASEEEKKEYIKKVREYCKEMYEWFSKSEFTGEPLWIEVSHTFREHTIRNMTQTMILNWIQLLLMRGVHVNRGRNISRENALVQCFKSAYFIPLTLAEDVENEAAKGNSSKYKIQNETKSQYKDDSQIDENNINTEAVSIGSPGQEYLRSKFIEMNASNDTNKSPNRKKNIDSGFKTETRTDCLGINGMIKSFQNRKKFSGSWDENLEEAITNYNIFSRICKLSEQEKADAVPYMLEGEAFTFFSQKIPPNTTFDEITKELRKWFTSSEKQARILKKWQEMRLSTEMEKSPDKSEIEVFRTFSFKLSTLQKQLAEHYQHDDFLRDQLVQSVDHTQIQKALRERLPSNSQEAANRITTFLSDEPNSAQSYSSSSADSANYGLGIKYGGQAEGINQRYGRKYKGERKLSTRWLRGIKGCYVCRKDHLAHTRHSPEEVRRAIERLKKEHPKALISVEDLSFIADDLHDDTEDNESIFESDSEEANFADTSTELDENTEIYLSNIAYLHGNSFTKDLEKDYKQMEAALYTEPCSKFRGIKLDTCANRSSIMSYAQYKAYCEEFQVPFKISWNNKDCKTISGIGGSRDAIGTALIPIPFKDLDLIIDVRFQIMKENIPSLLCMKDMIINNLDISIQKQNISHGDKSQKLFFENYFLIHKWKPSDVSFSLYTESHLKRLHRVFGHPSVQALHNLLKRADPSNLSKDTKHTLMEISKQCEVCMKYASKPRRFKLTIGTEDLQFNHTIAVDVMHLAGKAVLHIVDEATHFSAAQFLRKQSTPEVWKALLRCWTRVYLGPPDFIRVDQGSNLISDEFKGNAQAEGITVLEAPVESPSTMSHVERYHLPLRAAFNKIRASLSRDENDADCLQLAVKAVNDCAGPEGLCPTLLVFGTFPRPARNTPSATQIQRARAKDLAIKEVLKEHAKRKVAFGMKHYRGPKGKEYNAELNKLPAGAPVYVYRDRSKSWEGPFPFLNIDGETVVVQLPKGRKLFRSCVVKPKYRSHLNEVFYCEDNLQITEPEILALFGSTAVRIAKKEESEQFKDSRLKEIKGLFENNTFEIVKRYTAPSGTRFFGSRFIDAYKTVDGELVKKSRLIAQNYNDQAAATIATKSPTISRVAQRSCVAIAPSYKNHKPYSRDISQAYSQAHTNLERPVYLIAPPEMQLADDDVLLVRKPLYGIPESGLHWFLSFQGQHIKHLHMVPTKMDPCILSSRSNGEIDGICALQVDDVFGYGTDAFLDKEDKVISKFKSKPRKILNPGEKIVFNGTTVKFEKDKSYRLCQKEKLQDLTNATTPTEFHSTRAKLQYIGVMSRPDICAQTQLLSNGTSDPSNEDYKKLNKIVEWCNKTSNIGLTYKALDLDTCRLCLFTDASFANSKNFKSQIGFLLALVDGNNVANILHYGSSRCQRVTRSVMAAEIHGLLYGFDNALITKHLLRELINKDFDIHTYVDSKTLFNVVAKDAKTLEKRLQIDVWSIRESLKNGELKLLSWIPGKFNFADGLTKELINEHHPLWKLMQKNEINIQTNGWVENTVGKNSKIEK